MMAQDFIVLNEQSGNGMITINKSVFQAIAEISVDDIENAVRQPATTWVKPIQVRVDENKLNISADIKVKYGANVEATCELVQNKIYENILQMTGFKANDISVHVDGFVI